MIKRNPSIRWNVLSEACSPVVRSVASLYTNMKVYAGANHQQQAQQPIKVEI
jgi:large subunit ribosomal protein L13